MNKILLSSLFLVAVLSVASAEQVVPKAAAPAVAKIVKATKAVVKTVIGTVKSVSVADVAKGKKSEIVVADATGTAMTVLVKTNTTLYDVDAKAITLDKILAGSKVSAMYVTSAEGINEAKSVKVTK